MAQRDSGDNRSDVLTCADGCSGDDPIWVRQLGSAGTLDDRATAIASSNDGHVTVVGITRGTLAGSSNANAGGEDVFVARYDSAGQQHWVRQLGSNSNERAFATAVDEARAVYVVGYTQGHLPGSPDENAETADVFVARLGPGGDRLWVRQLATQEEDYARGVAADADGGVVLTGHTFGAMPGSSPLNAGASDAFVARYDIDGNRSWVRQLGTNGLESAADVAVDSAGLVYIVGDTAGTLPGSRTESSGEDDMFVATFGPDGGSLSVDQLGTAAPDGAHGLAFDGGGGVYVAGFTNGSLSPTQVNRGAEDAFVVKYAMHRPSR